MKTPDIMTREGTQNASTGNFKETNSDWIITLLICKNFLWDVKNKHSCQFLIFNWIYHTYLYKISLYIFKFFNISMCLINNIFLFYRFILWINLFLSMVSRGLLVSDTSTGAWMKSCIRFCLGIMLELWWFRLTFVLACSINALTLRPSLHLLLMLSYPCHAFFLSHYFTW